MDGEDDVQIEPEHEGEVSGGDAEAKVKKLKDELAEVKKEKQEYMDGWQRSKADYVNLLKRLEEEKKAERTKGVVKAAEALLPAFDALERAKEHGDVPAGFAAIVKQLEGGFASLHLEAFGAVGETFDPALHDALGQDSAETVETDGTVSVVLEKGWKIGDAIIRPAKVRVAHFASA